MKLLINTEVLRAAAEKVAEGYESDLYQLGRLDYDDLTELRWQFNELHDAASEPLVSLSGDAARYVGVSVGDTFNDDACFDSQQAHAWIILNEGSLAYRAFASIDKLCGSDITSSSQDCGVPTLADQLVGYFQCVVQELNYRLESDARFWSAAHQHTPAD